MASFTPLDKFTDARGWSLNDIYRQATTNIKKRQIEARSNYSENVYKLDDLQINYSILHPGVIKAWHRHENQDDYFCVVHGMAQVGVYDEVAAAAGADGAQKFFIGEHNPGVIHIEAGEWHGLTAVGTKPVGLLYLVTNIYNPHLPDEERAPHDSFVGHDWWLPENQ